MSIEKNPHEHKEFSLKEKLNKAKNLLKEGKFQDALKLLQTLRVDIPANSQEYLDSLMYEGICEFLSDNEQTGREKLFQASLGNPDKFQTDMLLFAKEFPKILPITNRYIQERNDKDLL